MQTPNDSESQIRETHAAGDMRLAVTLALERFGPEIARFLRARLRSPAQAEDAFSQFSEDLWVGLPNFRWHASLRVWLFILARNAAIRTGRVRWRELPLSSVRRNGMLPPVRTSTAQFLKTAVKNRMRQLRLALDEDEQTLLILRVDRGLAWKELTLVMGEVAPDATEEVIKRAAARLRTRYQTAKSKLRERAVAEGLLELEPTNSVSQPH